MTSMEAAQSGLAEAVLAYVPVRRLPASVRMRLPLPCSVSDTAHGKAEFGCFSQPVPLRARSASPSWKHRQPGHVISSRQGLTIPARCSPESGMCPGNRLQLHQEANLLLS
jgi:hypothetical protein